MKLAGTFKPPTLKSSKDLKSEDLVTVESGHRLHVFNGRLMGQVNIAGVYFLHQVEYLTEYRGWNNLNTSELDIVEVIRNGEVVYER